MIVLAIDSSGTSCAVCVWQDGHILAHKQEHMERGQDTRLMSMIMAVMAQAGQTFVALDKVAVMRGPGSFTGIRIGLAAAKGIGISADKPVIGIDRFSAYHALHADENILVVLASKRAELFCKFFPTMGVPYQPALMTEKEIAIFIVNHPDTRVVGDLATPGDSLMAACAELAAQAETQDTNFLPRPLYLRAPDVTLPSASSR